MFEELNCQAPADSKFVFVFFPLKFSLTLILMIWVAENDEQAVQENVFGMQVLLCNWF